MPHKTFPHIYLFGTIWVLSSIAGLAAMLRSGQPITKRLFWMSLMNSGLFGLGMALWLYEKLPNHQLVAVSIFSGLGGMSLLELFFQRITKKFK